ncbi:hypothetical protein [Clostridium sp. JS66]|uniref:hypothetical protein n=1 Tax=Clostridium sp. JS66 TaxID=3064705 RepID=UPI00298ECA65|nr:hypothetical protein [Clostridium sp. JS66]WPC44232.1 hypothetical protein Q6H37_12340 [Clostridium sp. JS66]
MNNYNIPTSIPEGYDFSNLSTEELKSIKEAEEQINKKHGNNLYLIAYDKTK